MPKVYIKTYGCQMNERDSSQVAKMLSDRGHLMTGEQAEADVVLINTCSVRDMAEQKALNKMSSMLHLRKTRPHMVYGFMGCGQIELARALFGKLHLSGGAMSLDGAPVRLGSTAAAKRAGIAFLPESRRMMLFPTEPVYKNVSISVLERISRVMLRPAREREIAAGHAADLQIRPPRTDIKLGSLSGGNQQKVALAKWLTHLPKVLILSEPTRGMDVGAKEDVIRILKSLRDRGVAILVLSTEPETILTLADRVTVMKKGAVSRSFSSGRIEKSDLG